MRYLRGLAAAAVVVATLSTASWADDAAPALSGDPVVIGAIANTTGVGSSVFLVALRAINDAVSYLNEHGGILGRPVKLVVENDEGDATRTPTAVRQLVDEGANALMLITSNAAVIQAKPVVAESKIISVSSGSLNTAIALPPSNDYTFMMGSPISDIASLFCGAWAASGIKDVAYFGENSPGVVGLANGLLPELKKCVNIVAQDQAPADSADLTAQIARIKGANPQSVLSISNGGQFEVLVWETVKALLPNVLKIAGVSLGNQPDGWALAAPGSLEGVVFTGAVTLDNPRTKAVDDYIRSKHPDFIALSAFDVWSWDGVMMIKEAITKAGGTDDKEKLRTAMESIKAYPADYGPASLTLSFAPDKHLAPDGACGLLLNVFDKNNQIASEPWPGYQPKC